jgi:multimeric flavodoxin WrbA
MEKSNTSLILNPFLEGMKEAGADIELFYTKKLEINPCRGCFYCWVKHPGKCYHKDDMAMLNSRLRDAEIWVFATPVYCDGVTGLMKNLMDRMIPLVEPFIEIRDNHCRHPIREGTKRDKVVLISNCGFWEMDNFEPLLVHMKAFCKNIDREFAGALLRPHGEALRPMMKMGIAIDDIFEAAREAGKELIETGKISRERLYQISRPLLPKDTFVQLANQMFQQWMDYWKEKIAEG